MSSTQGEFSREYFNRAFRRRVPDSQRNRNRLREILARRRGGRLLEIGCGMGEFLRLATPHFDAEAVDISEYAVAFAEQVAPGHVRRADIETEPLPLARYEVVAAYNVLEHLQRPAEVIGKICDSLVDGGILAGSVPNRYGLVGGLATCVANLADRTHISTFPTAQWERLFRQGGFDQIELFGEITLDAYHSVHVKRCWWKHVSFNAMFVCEK
jgi:2-polyprenyl-3-methyl-5-hydroxy-6-metoxy-1,4-benzoquinol methylase